ncbi:lipocalin family protein [Aquimarina sp. MMG015]|uniref:lipocalin family protein n=1 Tax=Aquimarina sp. MMG015 TaxID=2822689 RepID=UPI001B39E212|nr:lipocalin family protein [Aquimarina sp. MMG015]MBQ4803933.1 lipocalin family protein [Aquimarina sp. MMG015]
MLKNGLFIFILIITSCSKPNPETFTKHISGYWEIEKVITYDGIEKQYNFNQSIDYFEVKDKKGIRKKVQPQLDGNFITTKDREFFTLEIENDSLRIYYTTPLSKWKETLVSAKENQLIIKNEAGNLYFYKPYKKLEL